MIVGLTCLPHMLYGYPLYLLTVFFMWVQDSSGHSACPTTGGGNVHQSKLDYAATDPWVRPPLSHQHSAHHAHAHVQGTCALLMMHV